MNSEEPPVSGINSEPLQLLDIQRDVVLSAMLSSSLSIGLTGGTMDLTGPLDVEKLLSVLNRHVFAADAFNLAFRLEKGVLTQAPVEQSATSLARYVDLTSLSAPRDAADRMLRGELLAGLDAFGDVPPFRQFLFRLEPEKHLYGIIVHHGLVDGWGFSVWVETMASGYRGNEIDYPNYMGLVRKRLRQSQGGPSQRSLEYWLEGFPKAPQKTFQQKGSGIDVVHHQYSIDVERRARWKALADQNNLSMASLATASLLLSVREASNIQSPVIGIPLHNRVSPAQKNCIGMFATVLPLAPFIDDGDNVVVVASKVAAEQRASFRHMNVTMSDLKRAWGCSQETREPLEITFSFEPHNYNVEFPQLSARIAAFPPIMQNRPVQLYWREYQDNEPAIIDLCINPDFDGPDLAKDFIEPMLARLDAAVMGEDRGARPLAQKNVAQATPAPLVRPSKGTNAATGELWATFCQSVASFPDRVAVSDTAGQELTYKVLYDKALNLARILHRRQVRPDQPVGLALSRDCQLIVGMLAILAAGGAYVPIDPDYPEDRKSYLMKDSGIKLLLVDEGTNNRIPELAGVEKILVNVQETSSDDTFQVSPITPDQACYIIYTSGTTGNPKGCVVTHKNVTSLLRGAAKDHDYRETDVWTMFHSFAFDFSVWEIWGALATGGEVVVVDSGTARDPEAFLGLLRARQVTVLNQTPTAFQSLLSELTYQNEHGIAPDLTIRRVVFGGEALNPAMLKEWFATVGTQAVLTNMYGITETTVHVTQRDYGSEHTDLPSALGDPIPGWLLTVRDARGNAVLANKTGEIHVGGAGVTRGYLHRPRLTAERFIPDPDGVPGSRQYCAGDMARLDAQLGPIYAGRRDGQVKIRGFRIELGEIEAALSSLPGIRETAVLALDAPNGVGKQLTAWVIADRSNKNSESSLRDMLSQKLPAHMIPNRIFFLKSFPTTTNGKRDYTALMAMATSDPWQEEKELNAKQAMLAGIWTEMLGHTVQKADSNFFSLGGDSIIALRMLSRVRESGYSVDISQIYKTPTLAELAYHMQASTKPQEIVVNDVSAEELTSRFTMMATQVGMIYHGDSQPGTGVFHDLFRFDIKKSFDAERFQETLDRAVNWAAPLRTKFDPGHVEGMQQIIHKTGQLAARISDLRGHTEIPENLEAIAVRPEWQYDLNQVPLFRVQVDVINDDKFNLLVGFHHAILDGWSFANLMAAILADYFEIKKITAAPDMGQMQAEASRQQQQARGNHDMVAYWKAIVESLPVLPIAPAPRRDMITSRCGLGDARAAAVRKMAQDLGLPLRTLLLGVHFQTLAGDLVSSVASKRPNVTGYVANIRPDMTGADEALGMFLNTLPIVCPDDDLSNIGRWMQKLAEVEADFLANRFMPLPDVLFHAGGNPVFETAFNFVHFHNYRTGLGQDMNLIQNVDVFERTDFPFLAQFGVDPKSDEIELLLVSNRPEDTEDRVKKFTQHYLYVIDRILSDHKRSPLIESLAPISDPIWTKREAALRTIWRDITQKDVPAPDANLYAHGADSLLVTRFVAVVKRETEIELRTRDFLESPTLKDVARRLDELAATPSAPQPKLRRRTTNAAISGSSD